MLFQQNNFLTWSRSQLFHCLYFTRADSMQFFGQVQCQFCTEGFITKKQGTEPPSSYSCSQSQLQLPLRSISKTLSEQPSYCWTVIEWKQIFITWMGLKIQWRAHSKVCSREGMYGRCLRRHSCMVCNNYNMFSFKQGLLHARGNITKCN